ncbi:MAG TPA: hypothetical protein VFQ32_01440 [Ktedonobacterales bacterium]|nr:hypothetical protein [Ktedonobacterales bacterium]
MDERDNGFELEITDLETGEGAHAEAAPIMVDQENADGRPPGTPPQPLRARHVQRMRALLVASIVLLAVVLVVVVDPALRAAFLVALRPTPAPTATLAPDANLVFLESGASWGTYALDGAAAAPLSQPGSRLSSVWIRLTTGRHTLRVTQPPFPSLTCSISLPAARSDTCPLVSPAALQGPYFGNQPGSSPNSRVIDLGARFDRLAQSDADALVAAVRAMLARPVTPVMIKSGDHYLRDDGSVAVASGPLQITLQPELILPDRSFPSDDARCQSFCDMLTNYDRNPGTGGLWSLTVAQQGTWRVTTADGQVITRHAPLWPSVAPYETLSSDASQLSAAFDIQWDGSWRILSQDDFRFGDLSPAILQVAIQMTTALLSASPEVATSTMHIYEGQGLDAGQGWVISLTPSDPSATTRLNLYYHFGMLLAANDAAHHAFPAIPVASANERALARAIMGIPG